MMESKSAEQVYAWLKEMTNDSIYEGKRLAQPDEVANYKTADGLEKAFLLANVIRQRSPQQNIEIIADNSSVLLSAANECRFESVKGFKKEVRIPADGDISTIK
jgi:hypothetical protein